MNSYQSKYIRKAVARRSIKKGWIVAAVIALLLCAVAVYTVFFAPYGRFTFTSELCEYVFKCSPSEFSTAELDLPDEVLSLRRETYLNSEGSLVSRVTRWQWFWFKNSEWVNDFSHLDNWPCISLSEDYNTITVTVTPEMVEYDSVKLKEFEDALNTTFYRIRLIDIINDTERTVIYKETWSVTGETIDERDIVLSRQLTEDLTIYGWKY